MAPDGLDPCDLRLNRGDDAVRRLVTTRRPLFEFKIRRELAAHDLETVEGRVAALRASAPVVAGIRDQALGVGYVRNLAGWLGMDPGEVSRAVASARGSQRSHTEPPQAREDGGEAPPANAPDLMKLPTDPATRLERDALMAILQHPDAIGADLARRAAAVAFVDNTLAVVRDAIATSIEHIDSPGWLARVAAEVPAPFETLVKQLGVAPIPEREELMAAYCTGVATALVDRDLLRQKRDLLGTMQRIDSIAEPERYSQVQRDLVRVEAERRALRDE